MMKIFVCLLLFALASPCSIIDSILSAHNTIRANYNAPPLFWDANLAINASSWAKKCVFKHSDMMWGENMALSYETNISSIVAMWYNMEVCKYNYSNPDFSTGHFSQLVWASTKYVGCALVGPPNCTVINQFVNATMLICEYNPPGNIDGQYSINVHRPKISPKCQ